MTNDLRVSSSAAHRGWYEHNLSQLKYFRSLPLRQKLEAVEGMADVLRRFREMHAHGDFKFHTRRAGSR
jgi:hypothetical protein